MYKLVITCDTRTKKCLADPTSSLEDIETEVRTKFSIPVTKKFHMQYFDKEIEEYIDLDSIEDLEKDQFVKIKIVLKSVLLPAPTPSQEFTIPSRSSTPNQEIISPSRSSTPCQDTASSRSSTPSMELSDPFHTPPRHTAPTDPELPQLVTPKSVSRPSSSKTTPQFTDNIRKKKQWPKVYNFPNYTVPISTMIKLENNQPLVSKDRRDILSGIYQDVTSYEGGIYPTSERFDAILDGIFRQFPNITTHEGLSMDNSRELWKDRLKVKFQNSRRRIDASLPEIIVKKRKKNITEDPEASSGNVTWGLKNYMPIPPETEDDQTIESHITWMQKEFRKRDAHDEEGVDRRMALTLSHRRKIIVEDKKDINEILVLYPWLGSVKQLKKEFLRLGPTLSTTDIITSFSNNLTKYGSSVSNLTKTRKAASFGIETKKRSNNYRGDIERKHVENCSTVLSLPCLFRENITSVVKTETAHQTCEEPSRVAICYEDDILAVSQDSFKLVVEGVIVFKCNNFIESVIGLMMAIYTFNLAYPKQIEKTMLLLQKVFLGVDDESPIDKKLLNVMAQINQAM